MPHSTTVFVLGNNHQSSLVEALFDLGYVPILRDTMPEALRKIRHEKFGAIFVDTSATDTDELEFILNVRDVNHQVPVIIVGRSLCNSHELQALEKQPNTFLITNNLEEIDEKIKNIMRKQQH